MSSNVNDHVQYIIVQEDSLQSDNTVKFVMNSINLRSRRIYSAVHTEHLLHYTIFMHMNCY